ncbi:MAG: glycosyltransferase [Planctomycetes bacterium]|nr:glycosyltransferase [Planctomycetota bacterium]
MLADTSTLSPQELKKHKRKQNVMMASLVASVVYLVWRGLYTLPFNYSTLEITLGILLLACESVTIIESVNLILNTRYVKIPEMPEITSDMYLHVDILVVTHNEDTDVLMKTINGCLFMKYPDTSRVHIYICDDTNRPHMKELAAHMGVNYFGFDGNTTAKAGNLNYALARIHSSHVAIFDADMIPTSDFLLETVPYFYLPTLIRDKDSGKWRERTEEERKGQMPIGYVQTRQSFYNPDMLQRNLYLEHNAPCDLDFFYREVNVARMWSNSVAFGGSNTVFSRQALDDAGGILWSITEDMATSIAILEKGYRAIGLDKELAHGLAPDNAFSFITQRQRWSRGSAHDLTSWRFLGSKLPFLTKLGFFSSYLYWWVFFRRFVYIMCPILWGIFGIVVADMTLGKFLAVWVPYAILYSLTVRITSEGTQSTTWTNIADTVQMPYLLAPVVIGTLKLPGTFKVTPKDRAQGRNSSFYLAIPHIILTVLSLIAIWFCVWQIVVLRFEGAVIPLFWLVFNLYALVHSVVYYWGRTNSRGAERVVVSLPVVVQFAGRNFVGTTQDISEGGMAFTLDRPEYLPYDSDFNVAIADREYLAWFKARVCQVRQRGQTWLYSIVIAHIEEKHLRQYYQILYDRNHTLPRIVDMKVVDGAKRIAKGLAAHPARGERRLPRFRVNLEAITDKGLEVEIIDFNYRFLTVRRQENLPTKLRLSLKNGLYLKCVYSETLNDPNSLRDILYEIQDWKNPAVRERLSELLAPVALAESAVRPGGEADGADDAVAVTATSVDGDQPADLDEVVVEPVPVPVDEATAGGMPA